MTWIVDQIPYSELQAYLSANVAGVTSIVQVTRYNGDDFVVIIGNP